MYVFLTQHHRDDDTADEMLLVGVRNKYLFTKESVRTLERDGGERSERTPVAG